MENPFFFGGEVGGEYFTDRERELGDLSQDIRSSLNVVVFSPRRYGKTSLIKRLLGSPVCKNMIAVYVDLYKVTSKEKFIDVYSSAISEAFPQKTKKAIDFFKELLPNFIPALTIDDSGRPKIELSYGARQARTAPVLDDLYEAVNAWSIKKKKKAVVVFDEFQEIAGIDGEEIERSMRSHFQSHKNVSYIFMGSKQHLMDEIFNDPNRSFYRCGRLFRLGRIPKDHFIGWIKERFATNNVSITADLSEQIVGIAQSHPYYTQQLCYTIWKICHNSKEVQQSDIEEAVEDIIRNQTASFTNLWDDLTLKQRKFLIATASEKFANFYSEEFILQSGINTASSVQRVVKSLISKKILEKENGNIFIEDVFFSEWIRRVMFE